MSARNVLVAALAAAGLVAGAAPGATAKSSVASGIEIPFPIVAAGCNTTGRARIYPDVTPGLQTVEKIKAIVDSPNCPITWTVRVSVYDESPGFVTKSAYVDGTGTASVTQTVTYGLPGTPVDTPVRGPGHVALRTTWRGANGVTGCIVNDWVVASYADAYEIGPIAPCIDWRADPPPI